MSTDNFSEIGKIEAINTLMRTSGFRPAQGDTFTTKGGVVRTAHRAWIEGIDFDLTYFPLRHLGYKCTIGVTGELYSSLAHPKTINVIFGVSAKLDFDRIKEIWEGVVTAAREHGYTAVDLDLVPSPNGLYISLSATGETSLITSKRRMAAKSKDLICVSGSLGAAYLGMSLLEKGKKEFEKDSTQPDLERNKMLIGAYLKPELSSRVVEHLEEEEIYPSYGYFVTRGLSDAIKRLVRDSGLGAKVYADKIPFEGNSFAVGQELDIDPVSAAMNGGEDYRLLFTIPILSLEKFRRDFQTFDIIGHMAQSDVGAVLVTPDGVELPMKAQGWPDIEQ